MLWQPDEAPAPPPVEPAQNGAESFGIRQGMPASEAAMPRMRLAINLATGQSTVSGNKTTRINARRSGSLDGMTAKVRYGTTRIKKVSVASVAYRLHETYGEAPTTWENRIYGEASDYQQVARINRMLRALGLTDQVCGLMAVVDASMAPAVPSSLTLALHEAELADTAEQVADETFRHALEEGTATIPLAREAIRKSAMARGKAEVAEAGMLRWISEQRES